jgi:flagellar biosynthesis/type III secretory pathway M-ring protein FliF/YscJ
VIVAILLGCAAVFAVAFVVVMTRRARATARRQDSHGDAQPRIPEDDSEEG